MLIGEYSHNLDAKGRVFMPAKFREELGEKFIASRGIGKCLFVFSEESLERVHRQAENHPHYRPEGPGFSPHALRLGQQSVSRISRGESCCPRRLAGIRRHG